MASGFFDLDPSPCAVIPLIFFVESRSVCSLIIAPTTCMRRRSCEANARFYSNRITGGYRDHRYSGGAVAAGVEPGQGKGQRDYLPQQLETVGTRDASLHG